MDIERPLARVNCRIFCDVAILFDDFQSRETPVADHPSLKPNPPQVDGGEGGPCDSVGGYRSDACVCVCDFCNDYQHQFEIRSDQVLVVVKRDHLLLPIISSRVRKAEGRELKLMWIELFVVNRASSLPFATQLTTVLGRTTYYPSANARTNDAGKIDLT